ncbi:Ig-like domain-containing protein [Sandaracinus amylolyticus]|uniref:Ig-like domain-containing protein n=1 Tax=Sandaracinus amylolyticus TaxID=927083 RepID=UPI001F27C99F|nr:Ig-like domain-containing protein [Sandaracinus amylolyticus]UJR86351.1 Hypothetical protein I5071_84450 [Sandaracinus amylolyticus]
MRLRRAWWNVTVMAALALPLVACGDDDGPVDETDAATSPDAGRTDGGTPPIDSGRADAGGGDAGGSDAGADAWVPAEGPVVTAADPTSVAQGSGVVLDGLRLADPTGVTIGGVAQTVSASTATSITIDAVAATTPTGTQPVLVTTADGTSPAFDVTVLEPLAVVSAAGPTATSVVVTFSREVDAASVTAARFTIAGLTVSAASASGVMVTLTTSAQTPEADYTVAVAADVTDTFGNALTGTDEAAFVGFEPTVPVITNIAPMHVVPGDSELTLTGTNLAGATVTIGGAAQVITSSSATEIVIGAVSASTPLGAQPVVATLGGIDSAAMDVQVVDAFRIVGATATNATTVEVEFNRDVHAPVVAPARFTISGGLTVSAASVAGDTVTLTTSAQTAGTTYTLGADEMLLDTFGIPVTADTAAFTGYVAPPPSDFVVTRVGDGSAALSSAATAVFLERRAISDGALIATLPMPVASSGASFAFTMNGSNRPDGALSRSPDGRFLALAGYQSVPGTATVQSTTLPRVVAVVSADDFTTPAGVDTSTTLGTTFAGSPPTAVRGAVTDGTSIWVNGGFGGVHTTTLGGSSTTQVTAVPSPGRVLGIYGGQLYTVAGMATTSAAGLWQVGTGTPTASGTTSTVVAETTTPYGFAVLDVDPTVPGVDRIYLADDGGATAGGVKRFRLVSGTWTHDPATDRFPAVVRFLACMVVGSDVVCLGTRENAVIRMTDEGGSAPASAAAFTTIATPGTNTEFRGIAIAPVP